MKTHTFETAIDDVDLVVEFDYYPAEPQTYWYPGAPETCEIVSIKSSGVIDLSALYCEIENRAFQYVHDLKRQDVENEAEYRYEQRKYALI